MTTEARADLSRSIIESITPADIQRLKNRGRIGSDVDGVLAYIQPVVLKFFNEKYRDHGVKYTLEHLTDPWIMSQWYADIHGCTYDEGVESTKRYWNSPEVLEACELIDGAEEVFDLFEKVGLEYYFITSRPFYTQSSTEKWFRQRRAQSYSRLKMQQTEIYNKHHKVETIKDQQIKIFFEDMPDHVQPILDETDALVVVVAHPWNRSMPQHPRVIRPQGIEKEASMIYAFEALLTHLRSE